MSGVAPDESAAESVAQQVLLDTQLDVGGDYMNVTEAEGMDMMAPMAVAATSNAGLAASGHGDGDAAGDAAVGTSAIEQANSERVADGSSGVGRVQSNLKSWLK